MTQKLNLNDSSHNVEKATWRTKKIEITVLNVNVTYYLFFLTLQNAQNIKLVITHQSYRVVLIPVSEGQGLKFFELYWTAESVQ